MQVSFRINKSSISVAVVVAVFLAFSVTAAYAAYTTFSSSGSMVVDESNLVITDMSTGDGPLSDYNLTNISPNDTMEFYFEVDNTYANPIEVQLTFVLTYTGSETEGSLLDVSWRAGVPAGAVISGENITYTIDNNRTKDFILDVVAPNDVRPGTYDIMVTGVRT